VGTRGDRREVTWNQQQEEETTEAQLGMSFVVCLHHKLLCTSRLIMHHFRPSAIFTEIMVCRPSKGHFRTPGTTGYRIEFYRNIGM